MTRNMFSSINENMELSPDCPRTDSRQKHEIDTTKIVQQKGACQIFVARQHVVATILKFRKTVMQQPPTTNDSPKMSRGAA